jgi:hypothetical protein
VKVDIFSGAIHIDIGGVEREAAVQLACDLCDGTADQWVTDRQGTLTLIHPPVQAVRLTGETDDERMWLRECEVE